MDTPLPEKAVRIPEFPEYFFHIADGNPISDVYIYKPTVTGGYTALRVGQIRKPHINRYYAQRPEDLRHQYTPLNIDRIGPKTTRVMAQALIMVANTMEKADEMLGPEIERMEHERAEREAEQQHPLVSRDGVADRGGGGPRPTGSSVMSRSRMWRARGRTRLRS